jgi:monoterpene epsilon-lactone hydrolase
MTSLRAKFVRRTTQAFFKTIDAEKADVQVMRKTWHAAAKVLWTATKVKVEQARVHGLNSEWLTPKGSPDDKLLLYLHGGAYVMGNCATHRQLVSYIAKYSGIKALLPEYRLAPEDPFPAAIEDAVGLYRSLLANGYSAEDIVIAGDSAGGGLTMATLLSLRDAGDPLPAAACLLSPWLDLAATGESMTTRAKKDPWFQPEDMPVVAAYYCNDGELRDPLVSPVYADLSGLPPLYIQVGENEILLSDSTRAADKVKAAGGEVEIEIWPGMWHVFQAFLHQVPESKKAVKKIGAYVRKALKYAPEGP